MSKARRIEPKKNIVVNPYEGRVGLVYPRVSSARQASEGSGLDSQEERCIADLKSIGVPHEKTFPDTFSGGGDFWNRPAMRELLEYIDAHPRKKFVVVFDDLKRFARDTEFHIRLRAAFKGRDVILRCLNFKFDESPEGKFVEVVFAAQAELERNQNQRQVVQKMQARLEAGFWPFGTKKGYTRFKDPLHGNIMKPNEEGKILAEAAELFDNRTLLRKIDVCKFLVEKGFWTKQIPEKYIDKLTDLLTDPFYVGDIQYDAWDVIRRKGQHEGIISLDTFNRIQKLLKRRETIKRIRRNISPDFPLRGLLVCDYCGFHLNAAWTNKIWPYYVCHTKSCSHYGKSIRRKDIEEKFTELLRKNTLRTEISVLVDIVFERVWEQEKNSFKILELTEAKERKELEERALKLTDAIFNATSLQVKNIYEKQLEDIATKLEKIAPGSIESIDLSIPYRTVLNKAVELLKSPYTVWCNLDVYEQHRLFYFIFDEKLSYNQESGYRIDKFPTAVRLFEEFAGINTHDVEMGEIESPCRRFL